VTAGSADKAGHSKSDQSNVNHARRQHYTGLWSDFFDHLCGRGTADHKSAWRLANRIHRRAGPMANQRAAIATGSDHAAGDDHLVDGSIVLWCCSCPCGRADCSRSRQWSEFERDGVGQRGGSGDRWTCAAGRECVSTERDSPARFAHGIIVGGLGLLLALPFIFGAAVFNDLLWKVLGVEHAQKHELLQVLDETKDVQLRFWTIATAVFIAPISEELFFRGHFQTILIRLFARRPVQAFAIPAEPAPLSTETVTSSNYETPPAYMPEANVATGLRRWTAVIVTAFIFAVIHPWWTIIPIFVLALALGYVYERTGNLWTVIALHILFNASSVVLSSYA
jgi:membrane protease YdiL (CAAX protease family)